MSIRTWRRLAAALTAAAVTLLGGALTTGSAHADGGSAPYLFAASAVGLAVPDDGEGQVSWGLDSKGSTLQDVQVTVDITGISSFASTSDDFCVNGLCTFDRGDVDENGTGGIVNIKAKPNAELGTSGTAVIIGTASGETLAPFTVKVTVGAVDLVVNTIKHIDNAKPGSTLTAPITVANTGSLTAATTDYRFAISPGLSFATHFPNCDYDTGKTTDSWEQTVATCHLTTPIEPGKKYKLSTALKLKVKKSALYEIFSYAPTATSTTVPSTPRTTSAADLSLVPDGSAPPAASAPQHSQWAINAANTADLAVTGDTATAKPGATATLTATVSNLGPASVNRSTYDDQLSLLVGIPKGTTTTQVPAACAPWTGGGSSEPALGAPQYLCDLDSPFDSGHTQKLTFTVKVDADAPATTSSSVMTQLAYGGAPPYDTNKANNTGTFTVNVPGGAATSTTGGSGSTGGGNQPSAQTGNQVSATSGASGTAGGDTPAAAGSLASTGGNGTMTIACTGAAALALGGAVFAFARNRRARA
ncbi:hypothetical protein [Streptomyces sp. NPDC059479]|uniref:hypothetical protein n=1 Tax=Streptomyces sp. NPDC059479 TaxID=3346848 RepID=UPI0036C9F506